ncbi:ubiquinone biosynthesis O-methyltransferase, mitochondrial-like [Silene latifolia]|uniref:ubiquinone biosynthesis O-methyltransferase, mitochondrial-like n=1 Tax=Silene latifolia TaxID=37657 RepID=UPI003D77040D
MAVRFMSRLRHFRTSTAQSLPSISSSLLRRFSDVSQIAPPLSVDIPVVSDTSNAVVNNGARVSSKSSVDAAEHAKFSAVAETWWDAEGPFKPLHALNPTRLAFIRSTLCHHFRKDPNSIKPFEGLKFVDVGCGGGILSEPLARMGATVTGVDVVDKNIKIARLHAERDPLTSSIEYRCTTAEKLVEEHRVFDAVIALEVIEHVADPAEFCKSLAALTAANGATVISTINRTMRAYAATILVAEYILHWLPKGTHEWSKFVTPEELVLILQRASVNVQEMAGFVYNPLSGKWLLSDDTSVNYIAFATKTHNE